MDEFDNNTTPYDETGDEQHAEGSSRRTFLKAAVIGSATAVAVSGVGAATLTLTGRHTGLTRFVTLGATVSGLTGHACTTGTTSPYPEKGGQGDPYTNQESIYFWCKVNNVPTGNYSFSISPTPAANTQSNYSSGPIFMFNDSSSNDVNVYEYTVGTTFECSPTTDSGLPLPAATATNTAASISFAVIGSAKDVLLQVHLKGIKNNPGGSVTMTATLENTDTSTQEASAAATFYISA
jgi:hypothetical protein